MAELNTFNAPDEYVGDAVASIVCAVGGIIALVVAFVIDPRLGVALTWLLFLGGGGVAVLSPRRRPVAAGLAFAGAALPLAGFVFFWVWVSAAVFA